MTCERRYTASAIAEMQRIAEEARRRLWCNCGAAWYAGSSVTEIFCPQCGRQCASYGDDDEDE